MVYDTQTSKEDGVTVPQAMLEQLGVLPGESVTITLQDNHIVLRKADTSNKSTGPRRGKSPQDKATAMRETLIQYQEAIARLGDASGNGA